ncbi:MAG: homoserine dehydrogenase [Candidatus Omnitrophica bacterium]|nr:homoserine dehydrogenase [Candidatus Omnitrophota bacterium]MDD5575111.1 homoserine dehydrogenase [Candidatus Omnitrophota bacterium]
MKKINVGVIGLGTIGSGVVKALRDKRALIAQRSGVDVHLVMVSDVRRAQGAKLGLPATMFTANPQEIIRNEKIDCVVELIGGHHPAKELILQALRNGKHVVTANKALLAGDIAEILSVAVKSGRQLKFEASVGGGIPIIKALQEGLVANRVDSLFGIINGTSNYLLSKMSQASLSFAEALSLAKKKGYAERRPRFDVEGIDAAHKLVILCYLLFSKLVPLEAVIREGIADISEMDVRYAEEMGLVIKPLAIAKKDHDHLEVRVHATMLPKAHPLAVVNGVFNAILLKGDMVGDMLFYGRGAGQSPTASAVISDIVDLGRGDSLEEGNRHVKAEARVKKIRRADEIQSRYYLRFMAIDKPGILARISGILGKNHIGIAQVSQKERKRAKFVPVVMITHHVLEKNLKRALEHIDRLAIVKGKTIKIRMEGF